jgi:hypothetical protein
MKTHRLIALLLLCSASLPAAPEERVLVVRGHWPVSVSPSSGRPGAEALCDALDPGDVEMTWGGRRLEVTAIGPRPLPRTHALLIDASRSMDERMQSGTRFEEAKKAALEYIDALPHGDNILVASFNESLTLALAPTADKEAARQAVRRLRTGFFTALWDSLGYLLSYLDSLHGEKVVVLLSDGADQGSFRWKSFGEVMEIAAGARNLSVFPIGLGVSTAGADRARYNLGALAAGTGGEFFEIRRGEGLARLFRKVLERLDSRLYIAYIPEAGLPGGKVKVHLRKGLPCNLVSLGSAKWLERTSDDNEVSVKFSAPGSREFLLSRAEDWLVGSGPLFSRGAWEKSGRLRVDLTSVPRSGTREIMIFTPTLKQLRTRLSGPAGLFRFMLEEGLYALTTEERPAFIVHGRTFLELREVIGLAMLNSREDYRAWARERIETEVESDLNTLCDSLQEGKALSAAEIEMLREALMKQAADGRSHFYLAAWLGDLPAVEVAAALELKAVDGLIDGDEELADSMESSWPSLADWFPPATEARIITPLVPVYDETRDLVGFYRFVLPRPRTEDPQPLPLPERPLALRAMQCLMKIPEMKGLMTEGYRAVDLEYHYANLRRAGMERCNVKSSALRRSIRVEIALAAAGHDVSESHLRLVAHFREPRGAPEDEKPLCLWFEEGRPGVAERLNGALARAR